jgi:RNA polymerase sigma-70 factor (ECF subfamily)
MHRDVALDVTDAALLARSGDDPAAFEQLVERHHRQVFRYVLSRLGPGAVEDIVAETFLIAFTSRARFDANRATTVVPWLLGIATHRIAREREQQARWLARCAAAAAHSVNSDNGSETDRVTERVDAAALAGPVAAALAELASRERDPLLLHVLGGLSYEEVAAALDIRIGTVRSRISRATARLAGLLDGVPR